MIKHNKQVYCLYIQKNLIIISMKMAQNDGCNFKTIIILCGTDRHTLKRESCHYTYFVLVERKFHVVVKVLCEKLCHWNDNKRGKVTWTRLFTIFQHTYEKIVGRGERGNLTPAISFWLTGGRGKCMTKKLFEKLLKVNLPHSTMYIFCTRGVWGMQRYELF